jgi:hypothetical protein
MVFLSIFGLLIGRFGSSNLQLPSLVAFVFQKKYKKNLRSKTTIYLCLDLHKEHPSYRRSLQLSKENIQHFKTWNFKKMFYFCGSFMPSWIRIRISNPDPLTRLNSDLIRLPIRNPALKGQCHEIFYLRIFRESSSPGHWQFPLVPFRFFRKFAKILAAQGEPPVSTTSVANGKCHHDQCWFL